MGSSICKFLSFSLLNLYYMPTTVKLSKVNFEQQSGLHCTTSVLKGLHYYNEKFGLNI
jgi:hypothetical protein